MQFYFIRHAQSENNLLWIETGSHDGRSADPDLTPTGRKQAETLAQYLQAPAAVPKSPTGLDLQNIGGFHFTHLYCSLMLRAVVTGTVVARATGLPLVAWEDVHETGGMHCKDETTGGRVGLPGKNRSYFESHFPDLVLPPSLGEEGWWNRPFEENEERPQRARRVLRELLDKHGNTEDRVAIISHGGFYNQLMRAILDLPEAGTFGFTLNNTAIARIDFENDWIWAVYLNRVDHLPRDLIT